MPAIRPTAGPPAFPALPAQVDLPALEHDVIRLWQERKVFERSLEQTAGGPSWVFYEGPPTANGVPGTHHVEARAFKDLFCRYRTMLGHAVERKAGWDCHGLPVELAVEKELGFTTKHDIEIYGIAEFNARCRESVLRHVDAFERMSTRMGYWLDYGDAYRTMDSAYIESVWWSLARLFERGLLSEDYRIAPYCPRCETALSDHEVAQGYALVTDPSVYFRLPVESGPLAELGAHLLAWTTQPWTIYVNTMVAVHPDVTYLAVRIPAGDVLVVAEPLVEAALGSALNGVEVVARLTGRELEHTRYRLPYAVPGIHDSDPPAHYIGLADYVTVESGTGLVGQSPAFGAEDMETARAYGAPVVNPVGRDGRFDAGLPVVGRLNVKDADGAVIADLRRRGLLWREDPFEHSYPLCWRCDTPLLYYALPSWYVRTTAAKDRLIAENVRTDWHPATIRDGRYGDWLANNVDWALSRNRYWGTPLPLWRCSADPTHISAVGSLRELSDLAGRDLTGLDPHRPYVDEVTLACRSCGAPARRVPEVIDAWYDSGSMPFAQWGAPHRQPERFHTNYPAQFIAEGLDQTRGWFYTLMAVGTLVWDRSAYESVLCLGIILAEDGRRMSKHLGNVTDPMAVMDAHGADALRWFMLCGGSPWSARRVGDTALSEVARKVLLTYWNTASFLVLYANAAGWSPAGAEPPAVWDRPLLDRWLLSELDATTKQVTAALDQFDPSTAGRRLSRLVDDTSNWYVRRCRRRFWAGDPAALVTLHEVVATLARLLAPFVPFITEAVWQSVAVGPAGPQRGVADSVHLATWPTAPGDRVESALVGQVALVRQVVELGRAARASVKVKTRQPLRRAMVGGAAFTDLPPELRREIADELNVGAVEPLGADGELVEVTAKANFRLLGRRFGPQTKGVASAVAAADAAALARSLRESGTATITVGGAPVALEPDEVILTETPRAGWAVATDAGVSVALDLEITPELHRLGLARDVVRVVQDARKSSGLRVTDRIELWWAAEDEELVEALRQHASSIAAEVLATNYREGRPPADMSPHRDPALPRLTMWLREAGR